MMTAYERRKTRKLAREFEQLARDFDSIADQLNGSAFAQSLRKIAADNRRLLARLDAWLAKPKGKTQ